MRTTQQKFLESVEAIAQTYGMELVKDKGVSSTSGSVTISFEGSFEPVVSFGYDFHLDSVDLYGLWSEKRRLWFPDLGEATRELTKLCATEINRRHQLEIDSYGDK